MKNAGSLLLVSVFAFTTGAFAQYDDDVYYSPKRDKKPVVKSAPAELPATQPSGTPDGSTSTNENRTSVQTNTENARTGVDYSEDDYYDYAYASRIRRFHQPACYGGYYSNYYTDTYWYDPRPFNWGVSIYMGYNFWGPSYWVYNNNPYMAWSWSYGYYDPFFDPYWSRPYYGWGCGYPGYGYYGYNNYWGYGYGGYGSGYHHRYNNGYWNGYRDAVYNNNYYYNSFDNNSHYYGPRNSAPTNGVRPGLTASNRPNGNLGVKYESAVASGAVVAPSKVDHVSIPVINSSGPSTARPVINGSTNGTSVTTPVKSASSSDEQYARPGNKATPIPNNSGVSTSPAPNRATEEYYEPRPNRNNVPQQPVQVEPTKPVYRSEEAPQGRPNRNALPQQPVQIETEQPKTPPVRNEDAAPQGRPGRRSYDNVEPSKPHSSQPRMINPVPQQSAPTPEIHRGGGGGGVERSAPSGNRSGGNGGGSNHRPRR